MGVQAAFVLKRVSRRPASTWVFAGLTLPYTLLARAAGTFSLSALLNVRRRGLGRAISLREQVVMVLCGLRGGIAFALARAWQTTPEAAADELMLATIVLVLFTILAYGLTMRPVLKLLRIKLRRTSE